MQILLALKYQKSTQNLPTIIAQRHNYKTITKL